MTHTVLQFILEGAVALVDIKIIALIGIVGDVDIGPAVAIDIGDHRPQSKTDQRAMDAGLLRYLGEMSVVVAIEVIAATFQHRFDRPGGVDQVPPVGVVEGVDRDGTILDHKTVQVAVAVIVKKGDLRGIGGDIEAVLMRGFRKGAVVVIDVKFVAPPAVAHVAGIADVDIQPAVVVDVDEDCAGAPHAVLVEARLRGNVFKMEIAFIEIEFVASHVRREENIREAVVVDVADGNPAAVVEVPEKEAIVQPLISDLVVEFDAGILHQFEKRRGAGGFVLAGGAEKTKKKAAGE